VIEQLQINSWTRPDAAAVWEHGDLYSESTGAKVWAYVSNIQQILPGKRLSNQSGNLLKFSIQDYTKTNLSTILLKVLGLRHLHCSSKMDFLKERIE